MKPVSGSYEGDYCFMLPSAGRRDLKHVEPDTKKKARNASAGFDDGNRRAQAPHAWHEAMPTPGKVLRSGTLAIAGMECFRTEQRGTSSGKEIDGGLEAVVNADLSADGTR